MLSQAAHGRLSIVPLPSSCGGGYVIEEPASGLVHNRVYRSRMKAEFVAHQIARGIVRFSTTGVLIGKE